MKSEIRIPWSSGTFIIRPIHERAIRIRFELGEAAPEKSSLSIISPGSPVFTAEETTSEWIVATSQLRAAMNKETGALSFYDGKDNLLLREIPGGRRLLAQTIRGKDCFLAEQMFDSPPSEHLHGLGQFQDGHHSIRGISRRLVQVNTQIALPFISSNRGYSMLWHQYGLTDFNPADNFASLQKSSEEGPEFAITVTGSTGPFTETNRLRMYHGSIEIPADGTYTFFLDYGEMTNRHHLELDGSTVLHQENFWLPPAADVQVFLKAGRHSITVVATKGEPSLAWRLIDDTTTFRSPHAEGIDYVVFAGSADQTIEALRTVTGTVPLLPRWAYGFWQCRERYTTQQELLENAIEYRNRHLPVDVIVQDWQYWPEDQWAGMCFDSTRFPDPGGLVKTLGDLNLKLVISVWENVSKSSDLGKMYEAKGFYIPGSPWLDVMHPAAGAAHWSAMDRGLNSLGIAGWWLDATEPENDALTGKDTNLGLGEFYRLTYPLFINQAVFEGQRKTSNARRVCILSRSAFVGQQRYGSITWSGDIGSDWDAFRRQIAAGFNYSICGLPYWTTDIGGFFRPSNQYADKEYREILIRWFQFGMFNPIFRIHGFGSKTELWRYGPEFEAAARQALDFRYRLLPYIYSLAWRATRHGSTIMRPLLMDFPHDIQALQSRHLFMFGPALLVAPVTEPGVTSVTVYLPSSADWFDFWTGTLHAGGTFAETTISIDHIPLFVRAGSLLPVGPSLQHTAEFPANPIEIRIYSGADATFTLYEDEGDNYQYEEGCFTEIPIAWDEAQQTLILGQRKGSYVGMLMERTFRAVWVGPDHGVGSQLTELSDMEISYSGEGVIVGRPIDKAGRSGMN